MSRVALSYGGANRSVSRGRCTQVGPPSILHINVPLSSSGFVVDAEGGAHPQRRQGWLATGGEMSGLPQPKFTGTVIVVQCSPRSWESSSCTVLSLLSSRPCASSSPVPGLIQNCPIC